MTTLTDPERYLTADDVTDSIAVDAFGHQMRTHYSGTAIPGVDAYVADCVAHALYTAHLGATDLHDLHARILEQSNAAANTAKLFRDERRNATVNDPVRRLELTCARRMEHVAAELRRLAVALLVENADRW